MPQIITRRSTEIRTALSRTRTAIESEFATVASGLIVATIVGSVAMGGWVGATSGGLLTRLPL